MRPFHSNRPGAASTPEAVRTQVFQAGVPTLLTIAREPVVAVGLIAGAAELSLAFADEFDADGERCAPGRYRLRGAGDRISLMDQSGTTRLAAPALRLQPVGAPFTLHDVVIGIDFHWQRKQDQQFKGALCVGRDAQSRLLAVNEIGVEDYITSVISSEMSATAHDELLKAHAVISRSWLLAQLAPWKVARRKPACARVGDELIRWYDGESHTAFDVCADDHCQRYQGVTKATSPRVFAAIAATRGLVLSAGDELCDARFSKACGGLTERFAAAWEDRDVPYLQAVYDGETVPPQFALPLADETNAEAWIRGMPPAFCRADDPTILQRILPDFDRETTDFYRWRTTLAQDELQALLQTKLGIEFGAIRALTPLERGASGRIVRLRIEGERDVLTVGKELEIRRALSPSHLYSSAFVVEAGATRGGVPASFTLHGAGWGHGVGLCQIGAALMAERGYDFRRLLAHYYRGATLHALYAD